MGAVREIRGVTPATPLPDAPPYVRGVINLRGQVMPVIDLSERLGKGVAADSARQVIIVVEHHDDVAGLLVDAVCDSFIVSADAISPPPPLGEDVASPLVSAVITTEADHDRAAVGRRRCCPSAGWRSQPRFLLPRETGKSVRRPGPMEAASPSRRPLRHAAYSQRAYPRSPRCG